VAIFYILKSLIYVFTKTFKTLICFSQHGYETSIDSGRDTLGVASNVGSHLSLDSRTSQHSSNSSGGGGGVGYPPEQVGGKGSLSRGSRQSEPPPLPVQNHRVLPAPGPQQHNASNRWVWLMSLKTVWYYMGCCCTKLSVCLHQPSVGCISS